MALSTIRRYLERHPWVLIGSFILILAVIGWFAHFSFGVSEDEPAVQKFGQDTLVYVLYGGPVPTVLDWKFYNPIIQEIAALIDYLLQITSARGVWLLGHYVMFVTFIGGVLSFIQIARRFTTIWWALLGALWLVCTPRVFAHAFVNPKDIPALTFFTLSMLTFFRVSEKKTWIRIIIHSFVCALSISIRSFGGVVLIFTMLILWKGEKKKLAAHLILTALFMVMVWPALWSDPFAMALGSLQVNVSRDASGLYMGHLLTSIPWHYVPVWMFITIPILYTLFFLLGLFATLKDKNRLSVYIVAWLFIPILAQIIFHIGIFNEWRHLLFIYPAFVLIAITGTQWAWNTFYKPVVASILFIGTTQIILWMFLHNGLQEVYFSIPSRYVAGNFDVDYWGLTFRQGVDWVLENDDRQKILVYGTRRTILDSARTEQDNRVQIINDPTKADYILDNYSIVYPEQGIPIHQITIDGMKILGIYKRG